MAALGIDKVGLSPYHFIGPYLGPTTRSQKANKSKASLMAVFLLHIGLIFGNLHLLLLLSVEYRIQLVNLTYFNPVHFNPL